MLKPSQDGERYELESPTAMPRASSFLWNKKMLLQINCRGFATAQHLQPEPAKYSYAPNLEAKTFMQPEQAFYAHHPGRFVYIKDEDSGEIFSVPYEPVRRKADKFLFSAGKSDIEWRVELDDIEVILNVSLPIKDSVELWTLKVCNKGENSRRLSIYPYFTIGYMSWMNQSAKYDERLGGIVATCVSPYQKLEDYPKVKNFKDKTFFLHDVSPISFEANLEAFEGEGGLHNPSAIDQETLSNSEAIYETPTAVLQYREEFQADEIKEFRFIFGAAKDDFEIEKLRRKFLSESAFEIAIKNQRSFINKGKGVLNIKTPDADLNNFVNNWLGNQVFYHGRLNRLTTDPQTRNYLQDALGMVFINPKKTRKMFLHALAQQERTGAMPDGILLFNNSELKYINQVPHTDHCVWLPICLQAYLDETNDYDLLNKSVKSRETGESKTVLERISDAMRWLINDRDERGLNYIAQGDWCDPMNMVGHKGRGVSGWLSIATVYALKVWAEICESHDRMELADEFTEKAKEMSVAINEYLWDGNWFARGITDDDVIFGIAKDKEGKIFLNPQSWAMLAECINDEQKAKVFRAIEENLETPFGVTSLAPPFTAMREDIGRVTQKFPGTAENGSVYNHAAAFYIFALYESNEAERAFKNLRLMLPNSFDLLQRGHFPTFIPNYYRGADKQFPRTAGRSSQLLNTGTVAWFYRILIEGLFGVKGCKDGLIINPKFPHKWKNVEITRQFRGANFEIEYLRQKDVSAMQIYIDGEEIEGNIVREFCPNQNYKVLVKLPIS